MVSDLVNPDTHNWGQWHPKHLKTSKNFRFSIFVIQYKNLSFLPNPTQDHNSQRNSIFLDQSCFLLTLCGSVGNGCNDFHLLWKNGESLAEMETSPNLRHLFKKALPFFNRCFGAVSFIVSKNWWWFFYQGVDQRTQDFLNAGYQIC
jgi:hypothetical protein